MEGLIQELDEAGVPFAEPTFQADYLTTYKNLLNGPLALSNTLDLVNNLEPVMLRGEQSNGMLLAASDGDAVVLLRPDRDCQSGAGIK